MRVVTLSCVGALALSCAATSYAGPDWVEDGDAGSMIQTAQKVDDVVGGQVNRIIGSLTGAASVAGKGGELFDDFEDVYQIFISDPTEFMLSTSPDFGGQSSFQTSLWLFDSEGFGQLGNVYSPQNLEAGGGASGVILGSTLFNFATDSTKFVITKPGIYYVAITGVPRHPLASGPTEGAGIFTFDQFDEISGPDGPGADFPFVRIWGGGEGETGSYEIVVKGVSEVPAPGALSLLLVGLARGRGRRRNN